MEHMFSADELARLPNAFLRAGCGGVISSLWPVKDLASYFLWPRFYTELARGLMPAEALAAFIQWLRDSTQEELLQLVDSPFGTRLQNNKQTDLNKQRPFSHPGFGGLSFSMGIEGMQSVEQSVTGIRHIASNHRCSISALAIYRQ